MSCMGGVTSENIGRDTERMQVLLSVKYLRIRDQ